MQSKCTMSSIPSFFKYNTTELKLLLQISGQVFSYKSFLNDLSVNSRKHLPGLVLPALPARCLALALLIGLTRRLSMRRRGLYTFCFESPGSTTYTIPSIVSEVSAILVAKIIFLPGMPSLFLPGGSSKILFYYYGGSVEYRGST